MSAETYPVKVFNVALAADASGEGDVYKVEYEVIGKSVVGRFLIPVDEFDESKLPELIRADLEEMLPAIRKLDEMKIEYEGKELEV